MSELLQIPTDEQFHLGVVISLHVVIDFGRDTIADEILRTVADEQALLETATKHEWQTVAEYITDYIARSTRQEEMRRRIECWKTSHQRKKRP